jgi:hypothetical protein
MLIAYCNGDRIKVISVEVLIYKHFIFSFNRELNDAGLVNMYLATNYGQHKKLNIFRVAARTRFAVIAITQSTIFSKSLIDFRKLYFHKR